jgi:hypothetical protein
MRKWYSKNFDQKERGSIMNCLRFTTRTGLVALVAVLIVGGMMPAVAGAAEEEMGLFDPFALDAMISASVGPAASAAVAPIANSVVAPAERTDFVLRTAHLVGLQHPKLFSPFRK